MLLRFSCFSLIALLGLAACGAPAPTATSAAQTVRSAQPADPAVSNCAAPQACEAARRLAADLQDVVGVEIGPRSKITSIRAEGPTLVMSFSIPYTSAVMNGPNRRTIEREVGNFANRTLCGSGVGQPFYAIGGELRLRVFGMDGSRMTDQRQTACYGSN